MNLQSNHQQSGCLGICNIDPHAPSQRRIPQQHYDDDGLLTTEDQQAKRDLDKLLAQAMNEITFEERQERQEIIHGVNQTTVEEKSFIDSKLQELDLHLTSMKAGTKYEMAEQMDPEYVHGRAFLIMFLRAKEYDTRAAADQMMRFFESKYKMFGRSKLTKKITLADLDVDSIAALKSGYLQHGGMDRSGRQVIVSTGLGVLVGDSPKTLMALIRSQYYFIMRVLQSEETQFRGIVFVGNRIGHFRNSKMGKGMREVFSEHHVAFTALPHKIVAAHLCVNQVRQYLLLNFLANLMNVTERVRLRVHFGSQIECQYRLSTFGISPSSSPIDEQGRLELSRHRNWLHACAVEDMVDASTYSMATSRTLETIIWKPNQNDVLFSTTTHHAGNRRFHAIVKDYSQAYQSGTDEIKRDLVAIVIDKVYASGGRFLKENLKSNSTTWEELPLNELKMKIMQSFRNRRHLDSMKQKANCPRSGVLIAGDPLPNDVIFGTVPSQRNPGSELLHRLLKDHFEEYESLDRGKKKIFVAPIMKQIKDQGGRFLISAPESNGRWMEVSDDNAQGRISKYFRNLRRSKCAKS